MAGGLVLVNVATYAVVSENYREHLYRSDADSIAVPIFSTILSSTVALPFIAGIALIPHSKWIMERRSQSAATFAAAAAGLLISYSASAVLGLAGVGYWAGPHHYVIAAFYLCNLLLIATLFILDVARLWPWRVTHE
jgi:hypothetical protein